MMSKIDTYYIKKVLTDESIPYDFRDKFIANMDLFVSDRDEFIKVIGEKEYDEFVAEQFANTLSRKAKNVITHQWISSGFIEFLLKRFFETGTSSSHSEIIASGLKMTLKFEVEE